MTILRDVVHAAHTLWPLSGAEPWDVPGLVSGELEQPARRNLVAVDAVAENCVA